MQLHSLYKSENLPQILLRLSIYTIDQLQKINKNKVLCNTRKSHLFKLTTSTRQPPFHIVFWFSPQSFAHFTQNETVILLLCVNFPRTWNVNIQLFVSLLIAVAERKTDRIKSVSAANNFLLFILLAPWRHSGCNGWKKKNVREMKVVHGWFSFNLMSHDWNRTDRNQVYCTRMQDWWELAAWGERDQEWFILR